MGIWRLINMAIQDLRLPPPRFIRKVGVIVVLLAAAIPYTPSAFAADKKAPPSAAVTSRPEPMLSPEEFRKQKDWRDSIALVPHPKKGCFTAKYPLKEWQEVPCVPGPDYLMPPRAGNIP